MSLYTVYCPAIQRLYQARTPFGTAAYSGCFGNAQYMAVMNQYSRLTPEVEGGFWYVYGKGMGWDGMDRLVRHAMSSGQTVFYHCLRWWFETQPDDIAEWIIEAMLRYPSIHAWVVVNEGYSCWTGAETIPLIEDSFRLARLLRPECQLWYNGLLFHPLEQERVKALVLAGLVDAVGIQMHHDLSDDCLDYVPFVEWLSTNGVPWACTELDIIIPNTLPATLELQAAAYRRVVELCTEYYAKFLTTWGVADCVSWQAKYYPLPFDMEYRPKPAWDVLTEAV